MCILSALCSCVESNAHNAGTGAQMPVCCDLIPVNTKTVSAPLSSASVPDLFKHAAVKFPIKKKVVSMLSARRTTAPFQAYPFFPNCWRGWYCLSPSINLFPTACLIRISQLIKRITPPKLLCLLSQTVCLGTLTEKLFLLSVSLSRLELSAAFDTFNHEILLQTLHTTFEITGQAPTWFPSHLSN